MNLQSLQTMLLRNPVAQAAITTILTIGIGVLSGALITEISTPDGLNWLSFYKAFSFYGLVALTAAQVFHTRAKYYHDQEISRFSDHEYCIAYMRAKCLPEMAAKAQERIRNGQGGEFNAAMEEMRKVLQ